ncbi:hypothetical protein BRX37_25015 [Sphingomonas sp. S-NIH.Pt3_0716]|uniref:hypothetical protein n=1 Tax=Sphingobium yanoikuyae TaxID=13690 RepID=UPI000F7E6BA5|nr:hypothetical protein BRX37_25015 [Sphingomonas sp. S-NIH.Pt3_0716]
MMALSELQEWIMRELRERRGLIEGLPNRPGSTSADMEQAIDGLVRRRYVSVSGPPNQNSDLGKDVDELHLEPYGSGYLRTLR